MMTGSGGAGGVAGLRLGELELWMVEDVRWRLDGGMMFGTVPRVIWERTAPPDARNRVAMALRNLLIRGRDRAGRPAVVLVDAGLGELAAGAGFRELYGVTDPAGRLLAELAAAGVAAGDVTHVVYTHLHFDHVAGGVTSGGGGDGGGPRPVFPRARYLVHRGELAYAMQPDRRSRASYLPETWQPLLEAGRLDTVTGEHEVIPGVTLRDAPGHTDHLQVVTVTGGERTVLFTADLFPFASHLKSHYVPALDIDPRRTMESRRRYLELIARDGWLLLFQHDPTYGLVRVEADLTVTPVSRLSG